MKSKIGNGALRVGLLEEDCPCEPQIYDPAEYFRTYSNYDSGFSTSQLSAEKKSWKPETTLGAFERLFVQINLDGERKLRGFVIARSYVFILTG